MFLTRRFYLSALPIVVLFVAGYWIEELFIFGQGLLVLWLLLVVADWLWLRVSGGSLEAERRCAARFSNGEDNEVGICVTNHYSRAIRLTVIDELPAVFQRRDLMLSLYIPAGSSKSVTYVLHPVRRGVCQFGHIQLFALSRLGLMERRFTTGTPEEVKVYPSFLQLRRYELMAIGNHLTEMGIKRIRRIGHQTEFEHIREYVQGNDYRTINWKATARRHQLMVNVYQDERSQQVYSLIDKGRVMQQSFGGMTLLDYAINSSLVLSYVAMHREDKAGLVTFSDHFETFVPASRQEGHLTLLSDSLYKEQTVFGETDFSALCVHLEKRVTRRSLLMLYTNFMTLVEARRQLPYLCNLARRHCLLVVFFEDDDVRHYADSPADTTEDYYCHVIADKFIYEKRQIVALFRQYGIQALLTSPSLLTADVVNRYIEIKSRHLI